MKTMTSALLQQHATQTTTTTSAAAAMAWSTDKLRFSCVDNIGLKQLWKLIALDTNSSSSSSTNTSKGNTSRSNHHSRGSANRKMTLVDNTQQQQKQQQQISNNNNEQHNFDNCENLTQQYHLTTNRDYYPPTSRQSLLKCLAINALELSAPATPALLQHNQTNHQVIINVKPQGWMQLSGHPESIVPTTTGVVRKRVASFSDSEVHAYQLLSLEPQTAKIVPQFHGTLQLNSENFIELQDLLAGFKDPCVMDIKMGCRTFLECEVKNTALRADLYQKMIAVDQNAPTMEEHAAQAITKLRYMLFREAMSSSSTKGYRIEALRLRGRAPIKDLKMVRSSDQIAHTIEQFLGNRRATHKELIKRLKHMRVAMEKSSFFQRHEIVGSSIFIVYDDHKVGAWLIDFAKSRQLPEELSVTHRVDWVPGNREEGLLKGMDELINAFEEVYTQYGSRKCLQI